MIKFATWWKNRLKTDFTWQDLVVRVFVDLLLSNLGLFIGVLATVSFWVFMMNVSSQEFFEKMLFKAWLANIPALTLVCLLAYSLSGLYRRTRNVPYLKRVVIVSKSVGFAFILFISWIYLTKAFIPRSTILAGWFFIYFFVLTSRLLTSIFFRKYHILPRSSYDPYVEKIVRELTLLSNQDGWLPPEKMPQNASWPYFEKDEILASAAVLSSGKINQWTGKEVERFQEEFAAFCGVKHAIALANGSIALDLALYAMNIGTGDEVIVTPRTFIASASCVALRGAKPVFVDVDRESQNITAESIVKAISPRTRAVIAVHLAGWPCDMDSIMEIAKKYHLKVIEDCAQSHGAIYYSRMVGSNSQADQGHPMKIESSNLYPRPVGSMGDMAAFSFCQDKIMTTGGEGGMLLTNDEKLWEKAWSFKDHGKSYDAVYHRQHPPGFRWLHESFGTNGRLTEMQAAIGRRQLSKLPEWVAIRRRNAAILMEAFSKIRGLRVTCPPQNIRHSYYKYYVFVRSECLKEDWDRDKIMNAIVASGVPCFSGSCSEVYLEKAFDSVEMRPAEPLPVARELGETSLMFLVHPTLTEKDMLNVVNIVGKVMEEAEK